MTSKNLGQSVKIFFAGVLTSGLLIYAVDHRPAWRPVEAPPTTRAAAHAQAPTPEGNPVRVTVYAEAQEPVASVGGCVVRLLAAIRQVESGGNNRARGDGGKSRGAFQIKRAHWANAVAGTDAAAWSYDKHVWCPHRSAYVTWLSWAKVCPEALLDANLELLARCHRLPYDPWRASNDKYWRKVSEELRR